MTGTLPTALDRVAETPQQETALEALRCCAVARRGVVARLKEDLSELRALRPDLEAAVRAAVDAGMGVSRVARLAQVTRATVYEILRR